MLLGQAGLRSTEYLMRVFRGVFSWRLVWGDRWCGVGATGWAGYLLRVFRCCSARRPFCRVVYVAAEDESFAATLRLWIFMKRSGS